MMRFLSVIAALAICYGSALAQSRSVTANPSTNVLIFPTEANFRSANGFLGLGLAEVSGDLGLDFSELTAVDTLTTSEHIVIQTAAGPRLITRENLNTLIGGGGGSFNIDSLTAATEADLTVDTVDVLAVSDGGTEKKITLENFRDKLQSMTWAFTSLDATTLTAVTLAINGGGIPTTDAFGELSTDNDAWAASRGAMQFFDGTASTYLVGALVSDTPTNGQVPAWNTGGTVTWETKSRTGVYRTIYIDAGAMISRTTAGAVSGSEEHTTTNDIMADYYAFDDTSPEAVQFKLHMPDEWDRGTIKAKFHWYSSSTTGTHTSVWGIKAQAISDSDVIDSAWGTEIEVSDDVQGTANELLTSAASGAITVGGSPALGDLIWFEVDQDAVEADHVGDVKLTGVTIQFKEDAAEPASW